MDKTDNTVYVGKKETTAYVMAVSTQAANNDSIKIKARGKAISKAVDISQISIHRFLKGWAVKDVRIGTEERELEKTETTAAGTQRVSYIEIDMAKV